MAGRKVVVVMNRKAGALSGNPGVFDRDRIAGIFREAGVDADLRLAAPPEFAAVLRAAARSDAEVLIVGGGDGSVNTAVSYIHGSSRILGVLPLGTLNHFSQSLDTPVFLDDAVRALVRGAPRTVDIGEVNGRVFVNNASIGMYPEAVRRRERYMERLGLSKYAAMAYALLKLMWKLPAYNLLIEKEGALEYVQTPFLFLGNNRYDPRFPAYTKRESLEDGKLCVFYSHGMKRLGLASIGIRTLLGRIREAPELVEMDASELTIRSRHRKLRVALDGELYKMRTPLHARILPGALNVIFPGALAP